jgi:hypothetical protein
MKNRSLIVIGTAILVVATSPFLIKMLSNNAKSDHIQVTQIGQISDAKHIMGANTSKVDVGKGPKPVRSRRQYSINRLKNVTNDPFDQQKGLDSLPPGMTFDDIPEGYQDNIDDFLEQLETIESGELDEEENEKADPIYFSTISPDLVSGPPRETGVFAPYSNRIYAIFKSTTENLKDKNKVLVKWHISNSQLLLHEYVAIIKNSNFNYVWKEMDYWDIGIYNVEVYGIENDVRLLASGSFHIEELVEYISYPKLYQYVNQEFAKSAFYKKDEIHMVCSHSNLRDRYVSLSVYKIESQEVMTKEDILLPAGYQEPFVYTIKYSDDIFPYGSYNLELLSEESQLLARSKFYINE